MSITNRKERLHESIREEIKSTAWDHIARHGAAALSLRSIARKMELTAPALYRYYPNRDALVTALIIEAFTSLGDSLLAARESMPPAGHAQRLAAVGRAYRAWALHFPQRYNLIFGTPLPGYHAPAQQTAPAAGQSLQVLMQVLEDAWNASAIHPVTHPLPIAEGLRLQLEEWQRVNALTAPPEVLALTLICWTRVHGLVSLELYGAFPPMIRNPGILFEWELSALLAELGLQAV